MLVTLTHPIANFTGVVTLLEKYVLPFTGGTASIDLDPAAFNAVTNAGITLTIGAPSPAPPYDANLDAVVAPIVTSAASSTNAALYGHFVPKWQPTTNYTAGAFVLNPSGQVVSANATFTSGASYSSSNWTIVSGGGGTAALTPTATKTASYTAAVGDLAMMNVAGGAAVLTLPTAPANKSQVAYRAIGATVAAPLTVTRGGSDTIGTTGATSTAVALADETVVLQYDAPNTRWLAVANVKTQASLEALFAPLPGVTGGRPLVVGNGLAIASGNWPLANTPTMSRVPHVCTWGATSVRLLVGSSLAAEADPLHPMVIKASIEVSGVFYPVAFAGKAFAVVDPGSVLLSDPVEVDVAAGTTIFSRSFVTSPFGPTTTLSAGTSISATSLPLTAAPAASFQPTAYQPAVITVDTGGNAEQITVTGVSGTTLTCLAATKAHSSGVSVGQQSIQNVSVFGDNGGGAVAPGTDLTASGSLSALGAQGSTLSTAASAGDTTLKLAGTIAGTSLVVDTVGSGVQETVTARTVSGTAAPFTAYLTAPLVNAHASGVAVVGTLGFGSGYGPIAVVTDRPSVTQPKTVVIVGDSIAAGNGYNVRNGVSFATLALGSQRPFINLSKASETVQTFVSNGGSRRRKMLLTLARPGDWVIDQYGTNDMYSGRTLVQVQADQQTLIAMCHARGLKVALTTITPRTSTTDNWMTTGNQTISSPANNTIRVNYNNWLRGGTSGADLVIELADAVETARDSGIWKADASGPYTADGLHPTSLGHQLLSAAIPVASLI